MTRNVRYVHMLVQMNGYTTSIVHATTKAFIFAVKHLARNEHIQANLFPIFCIGSKWEINSPVHLYTINNCENM
jgi:hypothetical protein